MKTPIIQRFAQFAAILWLAGCGILLAMSLSADSDGFSPGLIPELYFCAVLVLSLVTWTLFGWDKWKASREGRRIPEKTLHMMAFLGGWPGAVIGQLMFRHKTVKAGFRLVLGLIVVAHVVCGLFALIQGMVSE